MRELSRRAWFGLLGGGAATGAAALLASPPERDSKKPDQRILTPRAAIQRRNFPNVTLVTHEGKEVRFYDDLIKDKFVTINMIYTSCHVTCPLATANLVRVQKLMADRVGRDLFMYSITLDPEHDSPEVLKAYARRFKTGKGWTFLTGAPKDIEMLRVRLGFSWNDKAIDQQKDYHTGTLRYGNEPHMTWAAVPTMANPQWVKKCILFADWPKQTRTA